MAKNPVVKGKEDPEKPFVCGTYVGNADADGQEITLGFRPSAVLVEASNGSRGVDNATMLYPSFGGLAVDGFGAYSLNQNNMVDLLITNRGFHVWSMLNIAVKSDQPYRYIAFR